MSDESPQTQAPSIEPPTSFRSTEWCIPKWYAVHTFAHHEKHVMKRLAARQLETFLPLYSVTHKWKNRSARLELPLFPGYLFVYIPLLERLKVLQVAGVARLVGAGGSPIPLPECEIESLKTARSLRIQTEPHEYLEVGRKVRVTTGPFEGFQGILLRRKGKFRVILSLELIRSSFVVDVGSSDVELLKDHRVV